MYPSSQYRVILTVLFVYVETSFSINFELIYFKFQREVQTSELIMLNRMFVADETQLLDQMKTELNANSNSPTTCSIASK